MLFAQADLFATHSCAAEPLTEEVTSIIRARLQATLELVRSASSMPWTDPLAIIREDNAFRFGKDALPAEEAAQLWAEFDREMDRLYATLVAD